MGPKGILPGHIAAASRHHARMGGEKAPGRDWELSLIMNPVVLGSNPTTYLTFSFNPFILTSRLWHLYLKGGRRKGV